MVELWELRSRRLEVLMVVVCSLCHSMNLYEALNDEGLTLLKLKERVVSDPSGALSNWKDDVGVIDPCLWFGVECSNGNVVVLNLKDLCLEGTLPPDIGNLVHIKSIILRNNSFKGIIPKEIGELKELEVLDLGYNNFSGPFPTDLDNNLSLSILLLDNNNPSGAMSSEIHELKMISEVQVDKSQLSNAAKRSSRSERSVSWKIIQTGDGTHRIVHDRPKNLYVQSPYVPDYPHVISPPSPAPSPTPPYEQSPSASSSPPSLSTPPSPGKKPTKKHHLILMLCAVIGGPVLLCAVTIFILFCQGDKVAVVKPWATGLSGQLQKAFVTGVPKLRRSELETACEDFSNVIGKSSIGTVYKGTLSSGVEIAVTSVAMTSRKEWSNNLEAQFRNKIDMLSKINHKNFMNLLGYCEENEPFTRMLVFEYAPNGTLFEHLHIKESEHLDWGMRMRIIMGMAYCLEHMHGLTPPAAHKNLNSNAIYLTEDYAAKVSDFGFWSEVAASEMESSPESNIYSFGVLLFEAITGRLPYSVDCGSLEDWASDYMRGDQPLGDMVDPTLKSFKAEQLDGISEVIKSCVYPDPRRRPHMTEITARLREITAIGPDGAIPRLSPLWWAELEIMSSEAS
ncbi:Non-specific serine/threonine protein kinase [Bertholletia excelsa]